MGKDETESTADTEADVGPEPEEAPEPPKEATPEEPAKPKASIKWGKAGIRCQSCRRIITKTSDKEKVPSHCPDCHSSALVAE